MITIPEMLARNARMYPDDPALIELKPSENYRREITWKEFDEESNRSLTRFWTAALKRAIKSSTG